jgi:hypothetical protein
LRGLSLVLLLTLGACAPRAAEQAEICALLAQPAVPGLDAIGDDRALDALDKRLQATGRIFGPEWLGGPVRYWGRCPRAPETIQMVLLARDGRFAAVKGGPRDHGVQRRFGTCFYAKDETRWRLLACRINGAS